MQHVCTGAVQRAAQYVITVMQREACSSVLCIEASAPSEIVLPFSALPSSCPSIDVRSGTYNLMTVNPWSLSELLHLSSIIHRQGKVDRTCGSW